jgi:hypothetical protein
MKIVKHSRHLLMSLPFLHPGRQSSFLLLTFVLLLTEMPDMAANKLLFPYETSAAEQSAKPITSADTIPQEAELIPEQSLILTGVAHDLNTNEVLMGIKVELYRIMQDTSEMAYSGTFLNGEIKLPVSAMHNHVLVLNRHGYESRKILVKQGQIDFDDDELLMHRIDAPDPNVVAYPTEASSMEKSPYIAQREEAKPTGEATPVPSTPEEAATEPEVPLLSRVPSPTPAQEVPDEYMVKESRARQPSIKTLPEEKASLPQSVAETSEAKATPVEEIAPEIETPEAETPEPEVAEKEVNVQSTAADENVQLESNIYRLSNSTSLRQGPVPTSNVLDELEAGDEVEVVKKTGKWWWKVRKGEQTGYVRTELLVQ